MTELAVKTLKQNTKLWSKPDEAAVTEVVQLSFNFKQIFKIFK